MEKIHGLKITSLEELKDMATFESLTSYIHVFCTLPHTQHAYELKFHPTYNGSYQSWQKETQYELWEYYQYRGRWNCSFLATDDELKNHTIIVQALKDGSVYLVTKKQVYALLEGKSELGA
jgi:hypothetical protein